MSRTRYIGIIALCSLMFVSELHADPVEEFGLGSRAAGMAGAYTSSSIGIDSVGTNPGGLALDPNPSVFFLDMALVMSMPQSTTSAQN